MNLVPLGPSGIDVSRLCLGTMQFGWTADEPASFAVMDAFMAAGGKFLDTADVYSRWVKGNWGGDSERIIGRWIKERGNRHDLVIATKCRAQMWKGTDGEGLSEAHIKRACRDSLRRLGIETIDLYQFHSFDDKVPVAESVGAMKDLVAEGKVRAFGISNYPPPEFAEILAEADRIGLPVVSLQPHHNLVHRKEWEGGHQTKCIERGMAVIPYSPLAKGFLTGKYVKGGEAVKSARMGGVKEYFSNEGWAALEAVRAIAAARSTTCSAVALAWQLAQPGITAPILGANSPEQLADQLPALELDLSVAELAALDEASSPFRVKWMAGPLDPPAATGQIVILNGTPRSGKSSIVQVIQDTFEGPWMNLGVDTFMAGVIPKRGLPGMGLRPGGERPDLEPFIVASFGALYESIAAHSRQGLNVVVDVGHHDWYSRPLGILPASARRLTGLPVLFVGVRCPIEVIMERRNRGQPGRETMYERGTAEVPIPPPVQRFQDAVHNPGIYDLEVDTSILTPEQCAEAIRQRLDLGPGSAFARLAAPASPTRPSSL